MYALFVVFRSKCIQNYSRFTCLIQIFQDVNLFLNTLYDSINWVSSSGLNYIRWTYNLQPLSFGYLFLPPVILFKTTWSPSRKPTNTNTCCFDPLYKYVLMPLYLHWQSPCVNCKTIHQYILINTISILNLKRNIECIRGNVIDLRITYWWSLKLLTCCITVSLEVCVVNCQLWRCYNYRSPLCVGLHVEAFPLYVLCTNLQR